MEELVGYSPWGRKESDMTEQLSTHALKCRQLARLPVLRKYLLKRLNHLPWFPNLYAQLNPLGTLWSIPNLRTLHKSIKPQSQWINPNHYCFLKLSRWVQEKAMAPHSSTLAWKIPWTEEPGRLQSMGSLESDTTEWLHFHFSLSCIREGNGNPLQCSCLENPRDGGAWWAAVCGVSQSRTRLKRLGSSSSSCVFHSGTINTS